MKPRPRRWDEYKMGGGAPPVETEPGWLEIYHGVRMAAAGVRVLEENKYPTRSARTTVRARNRSESAGL